VRRVADVSSVTTSQKTIEQIIAEQAKKKSSSGTRNTGELGKNDFLKLLITQVQYQDPLEPQSDTDFIAQMAQFSALEQMQNLNTSFLMTKGFSMIGKYATAQVTDEDTGNTSYVSGVVETVKVKSGTVYVVIDGHEVDIDKVSEVSGTAYVSSGKQISDYSGLVGMLGSAHVYNGDDEKAAIQGIIVSLEKKTDGIYARLDDVDVTPYRLDMTGYDSAEDYVLAYAGKTITVKIKDPDTGAVVKLTGTLRDGYLDDSDNLHLIVDGVMLPVDNIYSTEMADLYSSEHMLLQQILYLLRDRLGTGGESGESGESTETQSDSDSTGGVE